MYSSNSRHKGGHGQAFYYMPLRYKRNSSNVFILSKRAYEMMPGFIGSTKGTYYSLAFISSSVSVGYLTFVFAHITSGVYYHLFLMMDAGIMRQSFQ